MNKNDNKGGKEQGKMKANEQSKRIKKNENSIGVSTWNRPVSSCGVRGSSSVTPSAVELNENDDVGNRQAHHLERRGNCNDSYVGRTLGEVTGRFVTCFLSSLVVILFTLHLVMLRAKYRIKNLYDQL